MEKCITCGFLCKQVQGVYVPTPKFFEMDIYDRRTGRVFQHTTDALRGPGPSNPTCFRMVESVKAEIENTHTPESFLEIATQDRQCSKWASYESGFSPQDHLQDLKMNELELKRQQFEKQMADDHKAVILELDRRNRLFSWIIGFFALAEVMAALAQMAFPYGWPWLMRLLGSQPPIPPLPPMPGF